MYSTRLYVYDTHARIYIRDGNNNNKRSSRFLNHDRRRRFSFSFRFAKTWRRYYTKSRRKRVTCRRTQSVSRDVSGAIMHARDLRQYFHFLFRTKPIICNTCYERARVRIKILDGQNITMVSLAVSSCTQFIIIGTGIFYFLRMKFYR